MLNRIRALFRRKPTMPAPTKLPDVARAPVPLTPAAPRPAPRPRPATPFAAPKTHHLDAMRHRREAEENDRVARRRRDDDAAAAQSQQWSTAADVSSPAPSPFAHHTHVGTSAASIDFGSGSSWDSGSCSYGSGSSWDSGSCNYDSGSSDSSSSSSW